MDWYRFCAETLIILPHIGPQPPEEWYGFRQRFGTRPDSLAAFLRDSAT